MRYISNEAFSDCTSLKSVKVNPGIVCFGGCRYCTALETIVLPDGCDMIGYFDECTSLKTIENMEDLECPDFFISFAGCEKLEKIVLPPKLSDIRTEDLSDCKSLKSLAVPETVVSIWTFAFAGCDSLEDVYFMNPNTEISPFVFVHGSDNLAKEILTMNHTVRFHAPSIGLVSAFCLAAPHATFVLDI